MVSAVISDSPSVPSPAPSGVDSDDDWAVFLTPKNINLFNNFKRRKVACSTRGAWRGSGVGDELTGLPQFTPSKR